MKKLKDYTEEEILNEIKEVLNAMRDMPNGLDENTYHLFETVMKIAYERDDYKRKLDKILTLIDKKEEELSKTILGLPQILNDYKSTLIEVKAELGVD